MLNNIQTKAVRMIAERNLGITPNTIDQVRQNKISRLSRYIGTCLADLNGDILPDVLEGRVRAACLAGGVNKAFAMRREFFLLNDEIRWEIHLICRFIIPDLKRISRESYDDIKKMISIPPFPPWFKMVPKVDEINVSILSPISSSLRHVTEHYAKLTVEKCRQRNIRWTRHQAHKLRWRMVGKLEGLVEARQAIRKILQSDRWVHIP